jgi:hypothetical protein
VREYFAPPVLASRSIGASLETQSSQRENIFSFLLIPLKKAGLSGQQKRKDLRHNDRYDGCAAERHVVICFPSPQRKTNQ